MYSTCIVCHASLGSNEAVEHFPVGRRLAFDADKGRLWVVCSHCHRWNLTPVEERWEAIEECERLYRGTTLRVATDHIGLARPRGGIELIRIGRPLRPEFAAWRYGDQFGRRRRRAIVRTGLGVAAGLALVPFVFVGSSSLIGMIGQIIVNGGPGQRLHHGRRVVGRLVRADGTQTLVRGKHAAAVRLLPATTSQPWGLELTHGAGRLPGKWWTGFSPTTFTSEIRGEPAFRIVSQLLPWVNQQGAPSKDVKEAVEILERNSDREFCFARAARMAQKFNWDVPEQRRMLSSLPAGHRLALEMVANEDTERRALEGELKILEDTWREAEQIAAIADDMFLPAGITGLFRSHRKTEAGRNKRSQTD